MTVHRLPAGTDVAEMALFDVDAIPQSSTLDAEGIDELVKEQRLVRLPTGSDGGYLLHLYVGEPLPDAITRYCLSDDKLAGKFHTSNGRIAFGGVESAFQDFVPNHFIRSDARIPPGNYDFTAWRTDIPDDVFAHATRKGESPVERWLARAPVIITLLSIGLGLILVATKGLVAVGIVAALGYLAYRITTRLPAYTTLMARRKEAELEFPSIVIEMRSDNSLERTRER
jgi:hypothetical protein